MPSRAHLRASAALRPEPAPTINARSPAAIADPPETDAVNPMPRNRRGAMPAVPVIAQKHPAIPHFNAAWPAEIALSQPAVQLG
jgi:hypothetical protein